MSVVYPIKLCLESQAAGPVAHKAQLAPCSISPKHVVFAHLFPVTLTVCPDVTLPGSRNMLEMCLEQEAERGLEY